MRVCVIDDDDVFREFLSAILVQHAFDVLSVSDGQDLDAVLAVTSFDAFVVEVDLPGEDGLSIVARLKRAYPGCHVIIATARARLEDRVLGYETGADIYMTKPLHARELVAALEGVRRRRTEAGRLVDGLTLCLDTFILRRDDAAWEERLTTTEFRVLKGLVEAPNCQLEYWRMFELLGKRADQASKRVLEVHIVNLRKKLVRLGAERPVIRSVRGIGYRLLASVSLR